MWYWYIYTFQLICKYEMELCLYVAMLNVQKSTYFGVGCCFNIYINRHFNVMVYHNDLSKLVSSYLVQNVASLIIICLKLYSNIMKSSIQISIKIKMRILTTSRHGCEMRSLLYIIYWTLRYPFAKSTSKLLTRKFWKLDLYTFYY